MAIIEIGRSPIDIKTIVVATARDEMFFDLPEGCHGFIINNRTGTNNNTAKLRISQKKGEVEKSSGGDYFTIAGIRNPFTFSGFRVMAKDAENVDGTPKADSEVADGEVLEQRWYVTSEQANTTIEIMIFPGF